jgi:hypothetical protein
MILVTCCALVVMLDLQISTLCLISFNSLKQRFEVASTESRVVASLDDLQEYSWTVLRELCEDLQQVTIIIKVNQNLQLLQYIKVLFDIRLGQLEPLFQVYVILVWNIQELLTPGTEVLNCFDDVFCVHCYVLHPGAAVVVHILLDLRLALARSRLVDGHLDGLLIVGDHDGAQGRVLGVDLTVVHGPEAMEHQHVLIPLRYIRHLHVGLVSHDVVNGLQSNFRKQFIEWFLMLGFDKPRQEPSLIFGSVHECMCGVPISLYHGKTHRAKLIALLPWLLHYLGTLLHGTLEDGIQVLH